MSDADSASPLADIGPDLRAGYASDTPEAVRLAIDAFAEIEEAPRSFASQSPADLRATIARCDRLFTLSKDQLPVLVALEAAARLGDLDAMRAQALRLVALVEQHWDSYHPGPAGEMGTARVNEIAALKRPAAMLLPLARMPLVRLSGAGAPEFTAAMLRAASAPLAAWSEDEEAGLAEMVTKGAISAEDAQAERTRRARARTLRQIARSVSPRARAADAAAGTTFEDSTLPRDVEVVARALIAGVAAVAAPLDELAGAFAAVDSGFMERLGSAPGLGAIVQELRAMTATATGFIEAFTDLPEDVSTAEPPPETDDARHDSPPRAGVPGTVRSRSEVVAAIDAIVRYYTQNEPTSPVPLMLKRVRGWVNKDFLAVMQDLYPAASEELTRLLAASEI